MSEADSGWIPAWRKLYRPGHVLAPSKRDPSCKRDAWMDLCQMAQHDEYDHRGITLKRGEVLVAVREKAKDWGWSKSRVSRFFSFLASELMIGTVSGTPEGTIYRIENYDTYAVVEKSKRDTQRDGERDSSGTAAGQEQQQNHRTTTTEPPVGPPEKSEPTKPPRKHQLPDDWEPTEEHRQRADDAGLDLDREVEKFRSHAESNARKQVRWNAAFTTWLLRAEEWGAGKGNGSGYQDRAAGINWEKEAQRINRGEA